MKKAKPELVDVYALVCQIRALSEACSYLKDVSEVEQARHVINDKLLDMLRKVPA